MIKSAPELADKILDIMANAPASYDSHHDWVGFDMWWENLQPIERDLTLQKIIDVLDKEL